MMTVRDHGGRLDDAMWEYGGKRADWLDLSTGISPFSYPVGDIDTYHWQSLPDTGAAERLLEAARACYQVPDNFSIVSANGTQAIINQLPQHFEPCKVSVVAPTYNEHMPCWEQAGHEVRQVPDLSQVSDANIVVVVNPNNPDGRKFDRGELLKLASNLADKSGFLVLDEAFCDSDPSLSLIPAMPSNCIILRSFGKFFGLAGVRLGFAVCEPKLASRLKNAFGPWNVSGPALHIGATALADRTWISEAREKQLAMRDSLTEILVKRGCELVGSTPLFALVRHRDAQRLVHHLKNHKILVREFPQMPEHLRFGLCADARQLNCLDKALSEFAG